MTESGAGEERSATWTAGTSRAGAIVIMVTIVFAVLVSGAVPGGALRNFYAKPVSTHDHIGLYAADWKAIDERSDEEWDDAARNHDVLIGDADVYQPRLDRLHEVNPDVVVLFYDLGPYLIEGTPIYEETLAEHPDYFARTDEGALIHPPAFPKSTLMEQSHPGWRALHVERIRVTLAAHPGFDGVYVDAVGPGPVRTYTDGKPIDPTTGVVYTPEDYLRQSVKALDQIKAELPGLYVMWNGITNGPLYEESTHILAESTADAGMVEQFVREPRGLVDNYPSLEDWKANLDLVVDMQARGKGVYVWMKVWVPATEQQRKLWNRFALATYLLARDDRAWYTYSPEEGTDRVTVWYAQQQAALGEPLGPYYELPGAVFQRDFEHGTVVVKPVERVAQILVDR